MTILHIDTGEAMRGGQFQVMLLLRALGQTGHRCILLAKRDRPLYAEASREGIEVYPSELRHIWKYSHMADVVHAHDARAHTLAAIASRHKLVVSRRVAFPVKRSVASQWKYQRASRYIAVSQYVAGQLTAAGIRSEKIDVVHDAVIPGDSINSWKSDAPAVALAHMDPQKGRDLVARAAELAQIAVVYSDDLVTDLCYASLFAYITRSEGLGSAALLAMAMGVPVVASDVGGLAEVVEHRKSGLLTTNEPERIAAAMRAVLDEPGLAEGLRSNARLRVERYFSLDRLLEGTLAAYERALAS